MKKRTGTLALSFVLLAFALLFLGTIRLQDGLRSQHLKQNYAETHCRTAVLSWTKGIPKEEDRQAWIKAVSQNPELYLRAGCGDLRSVAGDDE